MSTKPIKRSQQLAPLSREHHDALLFVWKIRKGLENGTEPSLIAKYARWYWENNLQLHFNSEENTLLPSLGTNDDLAKQLIKEHELIRQLIKEIDPGTIALLADTLDKHIRFEERQLFPYIEETISQAELNKIHDQLNDHPECSSKWDEEFWLRKK